jgi:hypothetical protein
MDLSDSAMRRWLLGFAIRLVIVLVVVGIVYFHPLPILGPMQRIMFHPAFVVPLTLLGLWELFRGWRKQRGLQGA